MSMNIRNHLHEVYGDQTFSLNEIEYCWNEMVLFKVEWKVAVKSHQHAETQGASKLVKKPIA